jgi:hypothetical protein
MTDLRTVGETWLFQAARDVPCGTSVVVVLVLVNLLSARHPQEKEKRLKCTRRSLRLPA